MVAATAAADLVAAANSLLAARASGAPVSAAAMLANPLTLTDALAVQALVGAGRGGVRAWKVSAASTAEAPKYAPVFADSVFGPDAEFAPGRFSKPGVECELALLIGRDLHRGPYDRSEVEAAIAALVPLVEVAETRLDDPSRLPVPLGGQPVAARVASEGWWLADGLGNGAILVGGPVADWRAVDTARQPASLSFDGTVVARREGNPHGDLVATLHRLVNQIGGHCGGVRAGHVVTFGSMTGNLAAPPGTRALAAFPGLGDISLRFLA